MTDVDAALIAQYRMSIGEARDVGGESISFAVDDLEELLDAMTDHTPTPDTARLTPEVPAREVLIDFLGWDPDDPGLHAELDRYDRTIRAEVAAARDSTPAPTEALDDDLLRDMTYAVMDGTCDLADRLPSEQAWDDVRADLRLTLPVIAAYVAARTAPASEVAPTNAEALARAWDEGRDSLALDFTRPIDAGTGMRPSTSNPYRADRIEAGA